MMSDAAASTRPAGMEGSFVEQSGERVALVVAGDEPEQLVVRASAG